MLSYCRVCRINHEHGKNHKHTRKHKERLSCFLEKAAHRIDEISYFLDNPMLSLSGQQSSYWCPFCEREILNTGQTIMCYQTIKHLSHKSHQEKVDKFFREEGADAKLKHKFCVSASAIQAFYDRASQLKASNAAATEGAPSDQSMAAIFPAPSPPEYSSATQSTTNETKIPPSPSPSYTTLSGSVGVLQNPLGHHERNRVCDGGIVTYAKRMQDSCNAPDFPNKRRRYSTHTTDEKSALEETTYEHADERIPSPIDSLVAEEGQKRNKRDECKTVQHSDMAASASGNTLKSGDLPPWLQDDSDAESDSTENDNASLATPSIPPSHHSANPDAAFTIGIPSFTPRPRPVLDEYMAQKKLQQAVERHPHRVGVDHARKMLAKAVASQSRQGAEAEEEDDWLPSFGRVWQSGPRRETKREFEKEWKGTKAKR